MLLLQILGLLVIGEIVLDSLLEVVLQPLFLFLQRVDPFLTS